jgi:hypothetical protein
MRYLFGILFLKFAYTLYIGHQEGIEFLLPVTAIRKVPLNCGYYFRSLRLLLYGSSTIYKLLFHAKYEISMNLSKIIRLI